jgi:hypothetical protein
MERFPDNVRELAKEIAAFATTNVGTVYIGVECVGLLVRASRFEPLMFFVCVGQVVRASKFEPSLEEPFCVCVRTNLPHTQY